MWTRNAICGLALLLGGAGPGLATACMPAHTPIISLDHGSRYQDGDASRSTLDARSNAAVNAALRPLDRFIQDLSKAANTVTVGQGDEAELAACVVARIAAWAEADALSDLKSFGANLSVGSRIAGIADAYRQVQPYAGTAVLVSGPAIETWLGDRADDQIDFWEKDATKGARVGNLRAWAALSVLLVGNLTNDDGKRFWGYASATRILCTARPDGSLPQETKRGKYGLHYQFHAISPLVTIAAWGARDDQDLTAVCDGALDRAVTYAVEDYRNSGAQSEAYSGKRQSLFDGTDTLDTHELAWLPAYLSLFPASPLRDWASELEAMSNSKLGGDQTLIWGAP